jgi:hypothetical protein
MVPKVIVGQAASAKSGPPKLAPARAVKAAGATVRDRGDASVAYGTVVFVDRRAWRSGGELRVRLASIDDLPAGGAPKLFQLFAESDGAPNPAHALGTVVLQRISEDDIHAVKGDDGTGRGRAEPSRDFSVSLKVEVSDGEVWAHIAKCSARAGGHIPV